MTPECDQMAELERSRLRCLDMTRTDERCSSCSHNGTPSQGDNFVPQPVFLSHPGSQSGTPQDLGLGSQPVVPPNAPQMQGIQPPVMGDDPFRMYVPDHPGIVNLNDDDMPEMQNAPQWNVNTQGPLSQEGRYFQWQVPIAPIQPPIPSQPPVPAQLPAQIVAGVRHATANQQHAHHAAHQPHPQYPTRLWCTGGKHWVESANFGKLLTCAGCRAVQRAHAAQLRDQRLAQEGQIAAQLQLVAQIGTNGPQNPPLNNPPPPPPPLPPPPPPVDLLSATSPEDKILLENCRNKLMSVVMESCSLCHEKWFDLDVKNGVFAHCK